MNKNQEQILHTIHQILSSPVFDIELGDNKYLLGNLIAKYSNCGKLYISEKTQNKLNEINFKLDKDINYIKYLYGKKSLLYRKHKIKVVAEHLIPCNIILSLILKSDRTLDKIKEIMDHNVVTIVLEEEDKQINKNKLRTKVTEDFHIITNKWGRYTSSDISVTENYIINTGNIFR